MVLATATAKGQNWYFAIQPNDGSEFGSEQQSATVTIANTAPTVTNLNISPGTPKTADTLTANYDYADNDTDSESGSEIIWYKDGVLQGALNDSGTVDSSYTSKGEVWHFKIRPSDGTDFSQWVSCPINTTIANTAPSANNLVLSPSDAKTEDILTAGYDYSDADSDVESGTKIIWYKDGILQESLNNSVTFQSGNTTRGEEWHFKVQPFDGTNYGVWVNCLVNITIANTPPVVYNVKINGNSTSVTVGDNEDLVASYSYSDVDGDSQNNGSREILWYKFGILEGAYNN
ncbi:MAG: hypothetical protein ACXACR_07755 [Candidatus Hodarchaeales archaeon]